MWNLKRTLYVSAYFAWGDLKTRYKRSFLGPFWIVLTTVIGVVGLGVIWSSLLRLNMSEFVPVLTLGLVVWQFISGVITESPGLFVKHAKTIKNLNLPIIIYPLQLVMKHFLYFLHNLLIVIGVLVFFDKEATFIQFLFVPGLVLVIANLFWISCLVGLIGARFRDVEPLVTSVMPILFFLSPVLYRPEMLGGVAKLAWLNPFTYFISSVRDPLQGVEPDSLIWLVSVVMLIVGGLVTYLISRISGPKLAFWI